MQTPLGKRRSTPPLTDFAKRVQTAAKAMGIETPSELARKLKVSVQVAHKWWRGDTKLIAAKDLLGMADILKTNGRWLLTGAGSPTLREALTPDEQDCLALFRQMDDGWREDWLESGRKIVERVGPRTPSTANPFPKAERVKGKG